MIFVDTGAFVARWLGRDQFHAPAVEGWERLGEEGQSLVTTQHVLDETVTLLARRAGGAFAADKGRLLLTSAAIEIVRSDAETELRAVEILDRFGDLRLSFTDCVSFAVMRRRDLSRAFTFDHHFRVAGFEVWPVDGAL